MKSIYDFIIKPVGERYNNEIKIKNKKLILNTSIENWKAINRIALVIETPIAYSTKIKKGNLAASIFTSSILIFVAVLIASTLN